MNYIKERNRKLAEKVIKGLESRKMKGYYAETKEEAVKIALSLIPEGSSISWGGATSAEECGLLEAVRHGKFEVYDRAAAGTPAEIRAVYLKAFDCRTYIAGANAITEDGEIINMDGNSNRVAAICYGPEQVVMIVGMNKVVKTAEDGIARIRNTAAPVNAQRFDIKTPCRMTGSCADCKSPDSICCNLVIHRISRVQDRIKVILVNEDLGF